MTIFICNVTATTSIYTLSLHDALPILDLAGFGVNVTVMNNLVLSGTITISGGGLLRSEEHTTELQSRRQMVCRRDHEEANLIRQVVSAATVTFGSGITIRGQSGAIGTN